MYSIIQSVFFSFTRYGCYILPSLKEFVPEFIIANERTRKEPYVYKYCLPVSKSSGYSSRIESSNSHVASRSDWLVHRIFTYLIVLFRTLQEILWSMTKFPWRFLISSQITLHPWRTVRFRHRFAAVDMKPDMKSKHYDVVPISSQITLHLWEQSNFVID
jgi:hypothetical protein